MISNKLTLNYKKSCYIIVVKKTLDTFNFNVSINHNKIEKNYLKYCGIYINNNKLTWKNQIDYLCSNKKLSGMVFKLRHYVPFFTSKLIIHSIFYLKIQSFLLNWDKAAKSYLSNFKIF